MSVCGPVAAPWLSVIMPTYRGDAWIDAALGSVAAEAAAGIEVLVIDSSPTPATVDIARTYSDRLRISVLERPDLPMWHAKTNVGVGIARAPHVCWLHQDDLWLPGRAACVRAWIDAAPQADLHLAPSAIVDRNGQVLGVWRCPLPADRELDPALVTERLLVQNFIAAPAPVFRKDAWMACGGLDEALWYTADWDIWLKLAAFGTVFYHDVIGTAFRIHGDSLTMTGSRDVTDFMQQMHIVLNRHLQRLPQGPTAIARVARASVAVNAALASASAGDLRLLPRAALELLRLGPFGLHRYVRDSTILDRVIPRIRAKFAGRF